ncbi:PREDICTED: uncharacterized protein LOC109127643 [Camelina sativa]|uniref:Uncharacterized protein LOC109127643 n=1 Tax=Camelina sativa TaxID=90675 RepID=A0ABM1QNA0_CAMSA|nr:PREDICTED: uncharacterized protein LOC109127643 [Camelina sativa]
MVVFKLSTFMFWKRPSSKGGPGDVEVRHGAGHDVAVPQHLPEDFGGGSLPEAEDVLGGDLEVGGSESAVEIAPLDLEAGLVTTDDRRRPGSWRRGTLKGVCHAFYYKVVIEKLRRTTTRTPTPTPDQSASVINDLSLVLVDF